MLRVSLVLSLALAACDRSAPAPAPAPSPPTVAAKVPAPMPALRPIDPPATGGVSPNLVTASDGVLATWLEPSDKARTAHRLRMSKLVGTTWSPPVTITEGPNIVANWADVPSVAVQANGTLVAHWAEKVESPVAHAYDVVLARSTDGGATWRRLGNPHGDGTAAEHGFVSLLPDGDGVLAIWLDGRASANGGTGPTMLRASRITETIGAEQVIEDRVCDCCSTSAATTQAGPIVAYRDRDAGELRDPWIVRRTKEGWSSPSAVHRDRWQIAGCPVNGPMIVANGLDVVTAWYTLADQRATVRVSFSRDGGATFAAPIEVDAPAGARAPVGRVDVVIDQAGEAIVSWMASERDDGQLFVRRIARDGGRGRELAIAAIPAARDGGFPRMEISGADVVIAWTDPRAKNVRAVRLARREVPPLADEPAKPAAPAAPRFTVGSRAPAYTTTTLAGTAASLAAHEGHPILLNVWATWCEPCRHELPVLAGVHKRYVDKGLKVIALSVDREAPRDKVASLLRRFAPDLDGWHDPEDRASTAFGVSTVPTTLLFDRKGILLWRRDGAITDGDKDLEAAIAQAIAR